jgi:hypothetical protein
VQERSSLEQAIEAQAGFFDGDGCILYIPANGGTTYRPEVILVQNVIGPLLEFQNTVLRASNMNGCDIRSHFGRFSKRPEQRRGCHALYYWDSNALNLVQMLYPWLEVKRKQAHALLKAIGPCRIGQRGKKSPEIWRRRQVLHKRLQDLK